MVAASIVPGSDVLLKNVGVNPTRIGVIHILKRMGANIQITPTAFMGAEPVADIRVRYAPLKGITIPLEWVSLAIDEFPVLFVAASVATGKTELRGARELRVKETDRIAVMAQGLQALGIDANPLADGMEIIGGRLQGGSVQSGQDHRISMAFSVAATVATQPITVMDCQHVQTSFPGFVDMAQQVGMCIKEQS